MNLLLTRDQFRTSVLERDRSNCVVCGQAGQDAHHVVERRLWSDGGYYLNNGATVCGECHLKAEQTVISCEDLWTAIGCKRFTPPDWYDDCRYDKWGNIVLANGSRLKGPLFNDESVQKILPTAIKQLFLPYVKYPRTSHLPWSPGMSDDDRVIPSMERLKNAEVIATVKMDGENTTMYADYIHARSLDGRTHPSRNWVKQFHSTIKHDIPAGWRVCGENLYARHSIAYSRLPGYFMMFSIWNDHNQCLSWSDTVEWSQLLNIPLVQPMFEGRYNDDELRAIAERLTFGGGGEEGLVVRVKEAFNYGEFPVCVAKYVRANHVHTHGHWMREMIVPNGLKE